MLHKMLDWVDIESPKCFWLAVNIAAALSWPQYLDLRYIAYICHKGDVGGFVGKG